MPRKPTSPIDRFHKRYTVSPEGCWLWKLPEPNGYGKFSISENGKWKMYWAHRAAYILFKGKIPAGLQIDHLCRKLACVNPDHLRAITQKENILCSTSPTALIAARRVCNKGHRYTVANTRIYRGMRYCRQCRREWDARPNSKDYRRIRKAVRAAVIERDQSTCYICLRRLLPSEITLDHVRPCSKGGTNSMGNLRVACRSCNSRKGNRDVKTFMAEWFGL